MKVNCTLKCIINIWSLLVTTYSDLLCIGTNNSKTLSRKQSFLSKQLLLFFLLSSEGWVLILDFTLTSCPFLSPLVFVSSKLWGVSSWSSGSCLSYPTDWQRHSPGRRLAWISQLWVSAASAHPGLILKRRAAHPTGRILDSFLLPGMSKVL